MCCAARNGPIITQDGQIGMPGFRRNQAGSVAQFIQYVACHRIGIKPYLLRQTCSEANI